MAENNNVIEDWISKDLKFALASTYNKSEEKITKQFLSTLKEIDLSYKNIEDIRGIQFAFNTLKLNLSKNNISDVSYLGILYKLTDLDLSDNKIKDVSFLVNMKKLKSIGLECNNISYIPSLNNLKNLALINVSNNKIQDLSFIKTICTHNVRVIASDQCVLLNSVVVDYGEDFTFKPNILWDEHTPVLYDNVQVDGEYSNLETDERPSLLYSISQMIVKNICSNCIIKADFYHEVNFFKSGILSGILIQPILVKLSTASFGIEKLKKSKITGCIYGCLSLSINSEREETPNNQFLENKLITLIDSNGNKFYKFTKEKGEYSFDNLSAGRYTVLFPFISDYEYTTPSLCICNLKDGFNLEINSTLRKK